MSKLFLVRHGQTDWNKDHKVMGITDVSLNEIGEQEAENVGANLTNQNIDIIFTSPLKRALETLEIISKYVKCEKVEISDLLLERNFGYLTGKSWDEIETIIPNAREIDCKQKYDYTPYGGENAEQVKCRVRKFISELKERGYKKVLVVCHGGIIRMIESLRVEPRIDIPSGSITEFEV